MQINSRACFHVLPCRIAEVVFAANATVQRFEGFLYLVSLIAVRVIKHDADRFVTRIAYRLNPCVFFGDVVAVGRGVAPLDLDGVWIYEAIDFKRFRPLATCVWNSQTARLWKLVFEANLRCVFEKAARVLVKESALVLIHVYQVAFLVGHSERLVDEEVRLVVVFHLANAVVYSFLEVGSECGGQFTDFLFDAQVRFFSL